MAIPGQISNNPSVKIIINPWKSVDPLIATNEKGFSQNIRDNPTTSVKICG